MSHHLDRAHLKPPPPTKRLSPKHRYIPAGQRLLRLYDPSSRYRPSELTFRTYGPMERFDHHLPNPDLSPCENGDRGVWYSSDDDLACALVEIFGDERLVALSPWRVARPSLTRTLRLLDLHGTGAMGAGAVAEIAKSGDAPCTWAWSRYFYERGDLYAEVDGLTWPSAFNDGGCVLLFERAQKSLACVDCSVPLHHPRLRDTVLRIVREHAMDYSLRPI